MTEHNRMPARQIIVYGDCWPVTIAVAHLVRRFLPGCNCETAYSLPVLLQQLRRKPEAILILCLRPREHLFFVLFPETDTAGLPGYDYQR